MLSRDFANDRGGGYSITGYNIPRSNVFYDTPSPELHANARKPPAQKGPTHWSIASTIFSLSDRLFLNCLLECLRSFSSFFLIALSSWRLMVCAFFTTLGTWR